MTAGWTHLWFKDDKFLPARSSSAAFEKLTWLTLSRYKRERSAIFDLRSASKQLCLGWVKVDQGCSTEGLRGKLLERLRMYTG